MVFMPMGFMSSATAKTALPAITTPFWAVDMSDPLTNNRFYPQGSKGGTPISSYGAIGSILDMVETDGSWYDMLGTTTPLTANVQNGLPGMAVTTTSNNLYSFAGGQDVGNKIPILQGVGGVPGTPAPFTVLAVVKFTALPTGTAKACLFACNSWSDASGISTGLEIYAMSDGFYFSRGAGSYTTPVKVAVTINATTLYKVVARYTGLGTSKPMSLAVNALTEAQVASTTGTAETISWGIMGWMAAGYNSAVNDLLTGYLFEGRVWNSYATDAQRTSLLQYATDKWGS
jgi:hypothetical protein